MNAQSTIKEWLVGTNTNTYGSIGRLSTLLWEDRLQPNRNSINGVLKVGKG